MIIESAQKIELDDALWVRYIPVEGRISQYYNNHYNIHQLSFKPVDKTNIKIDLDENKSQII